MFQASRTGTPRLFISSTLIGSLVLTGLLTCSIASWTACDQPTSSSRIRIVLMTAASFFEPAQEIIEQFEIENPSIDVILAVDSSNRLSQQIIEGAPAHIIVLVGERWPDLLNSKGLVQPSKQIARNRLSLVGLNDSALNKSLPDSVQALANPAIDRLAVATPQSPLGDFSANALQQLEHLGVYLRPGAHKIPGKDALAVTQLVASGECDLGIVYRSSIKNLPQVKNLCTLPENLHAPIYISAHVVTSKSVSSQRRDFEQQGLTQESSTKYTIRKPKSDSALESKATVLLWKFLDSKASLCILEKYGLAQK